MKKILFAFGVVALILSGLKSVEADDSSDLSNESIIKWYYKDQAGQTQLQIYATSDQMPPEVKNQPKECWWDYNGWFNCHAKNE